MLEVSCRFDYLGETVTEMLMVFLMLLDVNKARVRLLGPYCSKLPAGETWTLYPLGNVDGGRIISVFWIRRELQLEGA